MIKEINKQFALVENGKAFRYDKFNIIFEAKVENVKNAFIFIIGAHFFEGFEKHILGSFALEEGHRKQQIIKVVFAKTELFTKSI